MKKFKGTPHPVVVLAVTFGLLVLTGIPGTSGRLLGTVQNSTNTASSEKTSLGTCQFASTQRNANFIYPLADATGSTTVADVTGAQRSGIYTNTSGVTYGNTDSACPRDEDRAITLNGSTGYLSGPSNATTPGNYSIQIWFKTTTTAGGKLMGFGSSRTGSSASYDRHIYMQNNGRLTFGINPNPIKVINSTAAYNDGEWHQVIATQSNSLITNRGMRLYVDGVLVASDTTGTTAQNYAGFWRIGYDNLAGWPNAPTSYFFGGSLSYAAHYQVTLTSDQVTTLYNSGVS